MAPIGYNFSSFLRALLFSIILLRSANADDYLCPRTCTCTETRYDMDFNEYDTYNGIVVDCTRSTLREFPATLPPNTVDIRLSSNSISELTINTTEIYGKVGRMSLSDNAISTLFNDTFRSFPNLRDLELNSNSLTNIQDGAFNGLANLRYLDMSNNSLSRVHMDIFDDLKLQVLRLNENSINEIKKASSKVLHLSELYLDYNNVSNLDFLQSVNVTKLELSGNSIDMRQFEKPAYLKHVRELYLVNCSVSDIHLDTFQHFTNLNHLDLSSNHLKTIDSDAFRSNSKITNLILKRNHLSDFASDGLVGVNLPKLSFLDLSYNKIRTMTADFLSRLGLEELDLSHNRIQVLQESVRPFISNIDVLKLEHNPFHCNCEMRWFREWLESKYGENDVFIFENYECTGPLRHKLLNLSSSDFACSPPIINFISDDVSVDEGGDVFVSCSSTADPAPIIIFDTPLEGQEYRISPPKNRSKTLTTAAYKLTSLQRTAGGSYVCRASNLVGSTSAAMQITVLFNSTSNETTVAMTTVATATTTTDTTKLKQNSTTSVLPPRQQQTESVTMSAVEVVADPTKSPRKVSSNMIIGTIVGVSVVIGVLALVMYFVVRFVKHKRHRRRYPVYRKNRPGRENIDYFKINGRGSGEGKVNGIALV